ncbi:hypothetical protein R3P38DRAFT_2871639 [Favolaschia claudopus]|uniref:Uncharacterized protein n=1 Tax=Favolaschia claudopus TaxID=2862362 RepID=A0AAW0D9B7_9AGAR
MTGAGPSQSHHFPSRYNARPIDLLRADTPLTSAPLPDDFDAITQTQRWSRATRLTTIDPTSTGLVDQLEAATRVTTPAPRAADGIVKSRRKYQNSGEAIVAQERSLRRMRGKDRIKASDVNDPNLMTPAAGQDYEIVGHRVLEEGPERTVSISTWREQAIQEADSDDAMSVYFVNPDDFAPAELGPTVTVEILPHSRSRSVSKRIGYGRDESVRSTGKRQSPAKDNPVHFDRTGVMMSSQRGEMKAYRSLSKAVSPSPARSSDPQTSTPRGSGTLIQNSHTPPFHAKKFNSESTISSFHLAPTLDDILISCEPSLLHISPVLHKVGIFGVEHLKAVGKLSNDTRNKEVKEEVLKLGVTVIEWAMLLDRLQSL